MNQHHRRQEFRNLTLRLLTMGSHNSSSGRNTITLATSSTVTLLRLVLSALQFHYSNGRP